MKQRILSFFALWIIVGLSILIFEVGAVIGLLFTVALLTQLELYRLFEKMGLQPMKFPGLVAGGLITAGAYYLPGMDSGNDLLILGFLVLMMPLLRLKPPSDHFRRLVPTLFGLFYVPYLLHFFIKIIKLAEFNGESGATGVFLVIWVVAIAKFSDVGGLLVGMKIGKTPLSATSPRKTYEGVVGGLLFSALIGIIPVYAFDTLRPETLSWLPCLLMAILIGIVAVASDLIESTFKRWAQVKDSGNIIPGIGGIFDLTDSLILSAPIGYLLFKYLIF